MPRQIASARTGAKTLLIERLGALGGQLCVSGPPGFAFAHLFNVRGEQDSGGIIEEIHKRMLEDGHALPHLKPTLRSKAGYTFSYVDADWFGFMIFDMMTENNVNLLLHSLVVDVVKEKNTIKGVIVENANGRVEIPGKIVIDCTGEGDIASRAGAPSEIVSREEIQPHSLSFTADGVDWKEVIKYINANPDQFSTMEYHNDGCDTTDAEIIENYRNVKEVTDLGEVMGYYKFRDIGLETGEWHGFSGVGFFLDAKGRRKNTGTFPAFVTGAGRASDRCMGSYPW